MGYAGHQHKRSRIMKTLIAFLLLVSPVSAGHILLAEINHHFFNQELAADVGPQAVAMLSTHRNNNTNFVTFATPLTDMPAAYVYDANTVGWSSFIANFTSAAGILELKSLWSGTTPGIDFTLEMSTITPMVGHTSNWDYFITLHVPNLVNRPISKIEFMVSSYEKTPIPGGFSYGLGMQTNIWGPHADFEVPEPTSLALIFVGLACCAKMRHTRRAKHVRPNRSTQMVENKHAGMAQ